MFNSNCLFAAGQASPLHTSTGQKNLAAYSGGAGLSLKVITQRNIQYKGGNIGFGYNNEILVPCVTSLTLYKLDGGEYATMWENSELLCGDTNEFEFEVAVDKSGKILIQKGENEATIQYSSNLEKEATVDHRGDLLDCTEDGNVMYTWGEKGKHDWAIEVYGATYEKIPLVPRDVTYRWLSLCSVGDKYAVVEKEASAKSLDIFSKQGKPQTLNFLKLLSLSQEISQCSSILSHNHLNINIDNVNFNNLLGKRSYVFGSVGLSVCLFVCGQHYSNIYEWIGIKFYFFTSVLLQEGI